METIDPCGLIKEHARLVFTIGRDIHRQLEQTTGAPWDLDAMLLAGLDGLLEAVKQCATPYRAVTCDTLGAYRIRRAILRFVGATTPHTRLPWVWRAQWLEAACAREQLQQQLGTAPTAAQLVAALGITLEEVAELDQWLEELVQEHARLVDAIVQRVVRQTGYRGERADLRQVGWEGLVQAAHKFDPARGVGFSTYATPRIRGAILDYLRQAALIRVPRPRPTATIREELAEFARARAQLRQQLGSAPTAAQLAAALDRSIEEVKELEKLEDRYKRREFRVRPLDPEDNELVVAPTTPCVEALHDCIRALPHSLKAVFVLCDLQELSEEVAAQLLKIALTQISQYRRQARQHVRTCLRGKGWNEEGDEDT